MASERCTVGLNWHCPLRSVWACCSLRLLSPCSWQTSSSWILSPDVSCPPGIQSSISSVCDCECITMEMCTESSGLRLTESLEVVTGQSPPLPPSSSFQSAFHYDRNLKSYEGFRDRSNRRDQGGIWTWSEEMVCMSERKNLTETVLFIIHPQVWEMHYLLCFWILKLNFFSYYGNTSFYMSVYFLIMAPTVSSEVCQNALCNFSTHKRKKS